MEQIGIGMVQEKYVSHAYPMPYTITEGMEGGFGYGRTEERLGPVEEVAALVWFGLWLCFLVQVLTGMEQIGTGMVQDK